MPLTRLLVFFDLESTGTDIANDRIVEICLLKLYPDGKEELSTYRINPGIPIPPEASEVYGIKDEHIKAKHSLPAIDIK